MTIIAAIKEVDKIIYGSDTRVTFDNGPAYDVATKWRKLKGKSSKFPIYIGSAGSSRLDNLILSSAKNFESASSCFEIADILKRAIAADGWKEEKESGGEPQSYSLDMLVIFQNHLYRIASDMSVTEIPSFEFCAVGSGEPYALGAAHSTNTKNSKERIKKAIQASIKYDPNCGGRVQIGTIEF